MQLEVGQILEGKITGITKYGAFVDLGDNTTGMVHISEVANNYVTDIREFVNENDTVKVKVLTVGDDGKIGLSIKKALPPEKNDNKPHQPRREQRSVQSVKIDSSCTWAPRKQEPASFEEMMNRFKQTSDEKFSDLKRKNADTRRPKRTGGVNR